MILYKCNMCGEVHDNIGEMTDVSISHAGSSTVNYPRDGKFLVCKDCENKLLNILNVYSTETMIEALREVYLYLNRPHTEASYTAGKNVVQGFADGIYDSAFTINNKGEGYMNYEEWEENLKNRGCTVTVIGETSKGKLAVYVAMSDYNGYYVGWYKNHYEILGGKENAQYWLDI